MTATAPHSIPTTGSIELDGVEMTYPSGHRAVRSLDLTVADGELHVLLGASGCGKSTILRLIAGLEQPTSGEIRIDAERVNEKGPRDRDVAMAFQEHSLYPHMTVAENLGYPLRRMGERPRAVRRRVAELADALTLTDTLHRRPAQLSGGQQQRVALGRAIMRQPRAFLMDEPLSNLDTKLRIESRTAILRLQRRLATTTVFVTHDQVEAMALADTITVMRTGSIAQSGTPMELYHRPVDLYVAQFLGSPEMNVFLGRILRRSNGWSIELGTQTLQLDGEPSDRRAWSSLAGRDVALGFRPEALRATNGDGLLASVTGTELLGNTRLVHAVVDARSVAASDSGTTVRDQRESPILAFTSNDDPVGLWAPFSMRLDARSVHVFDLDTGTSLAATTS